MITQMQSLVEEIMESLKSQPNFQSKTLHLNDYIDRQLKHLVVTQEFDFNQIAYLMGLMFPQSKHRMGKRYCEERWTQLHLTRKHKLDGKLKDNRKLMAVMSFENPNKLLTARELVKQLEIEEDKRMGQQAKADLNNQSKGLSFYEMMNKNDQQFDITKHKVRSIPTEKYQAMEEEYLAALAKAKLVEEDMCQKPYVYKPKFIVDNMYELEREDLTQQKAKQIINNEIKLDSKIMGIGAFEEFKQDDYKSKFQKQQQQKFQPRSKGIFTHIIQDKWSDYESDDDT